MLGSRNSSVTLHTGCISILLKLLWHRCRIVLILIWLLIIDIVLTLWHLLSLLILVLILLIIIGEGTLLRLTKLIILLIILLISRFWWIGCIISLHIWSQLRTVSFGVSILTTVVTEPFRSWSTWTSSSWRESELRLLLILLRLLKLGLYHWSLSWCILLRRSL